MLGYKILRFKTMNECLREATLIKLDGLYVEFFTDRSIKVKDTLDVSKYKSVEVIYADGHSSHYKHGKGVILK